MTHEETCIVSISILCYIQIVKKSSGVWVFGHLKIKQIADQMRISDRFVRVLYGQKK